MDSGKRTLPHFLLDVETIRYFLKYEESTDDWVRPYSPQFLVDRDEALASYVVTQRRKTKQPPEPRVRYDQFIQVRSKK